MAFVIHPLTQQNGEPKYTANDFRLTVSNFLTVGTDEVFGAVQGIRSDSLAAHVSMTDSTITVHPHSGIIAPWTGVGAYAYAITSDITVTRPTTGDYYIVLTVEDPSQSHGSEPQGKVDLMPTSTPRESINGLIIAKTVGSSISDVANRLRNSTVIETVSKAELDLIKPVTRTRAWVRGGDGMGEYEFNGSNWVPVTPFYPSRVQTWDNWNIYTQDAGVNLRHITVEKAYGSATPRFDIDIEMDLPFSVRHIQRIPCYGMVAKSIVSYGVLQFEGRRMHVSFNGYTDVVTVRADGFVLTDGLAA